MADTTPQSVSAAPHPAHHLRRPHHRRVRRASFVAAAPPRYGHPTRRPTRQQVGHR
ncbi:hypothetical protein ACIBO1_01820 [Micromonospora sp. NPDC049903]|uniref:hypothetical protein n=1 Tax=Micromonospora sp. NPDC049903 TaxID=3364276 RepID=UPI00379E5A20